MVSFRKVLRILRRYERSRRLSPAVKKVTHKTITDSEPPSGPILEALLRAQPKTVVCMGLVQQSRRSLRALLELNESGLLDTGFGLMRTLLENMVTAVWILEGPDENFAEFLGDYRRRLVAASKDPVFRPLLDQFDSLMETWVGDSEGRTLRNIEQRASAPTAKRMYSIYRHLSGPAHGSVVGSTLQFAIGEEEELIWGDPGLNIDADAHLAFSSALLCITAMRTYQELSEEVSHGFADLHREIMDAWFPDAQRDREPPP